MGTGLIYAAIVAAWLAYLVPLYLKRHASDEADSSDPRSRFASSIQVIRQGSVEAVDEEGEPIGDAEVSTPLTRRAAMVEVRRAERIAAKRRRGVLVGLFVALTAVVVLSVAGLLPYWSIAIPAGLLIGFTALARYSVRTMQRALDAQVAAIKASGGTEETITLRTDAEQPAEAPKQPSAMKQVVAGLWDPIPVTMPTYVSKPLAPRTVRTIDLSGPDVTSSARQADPPLAEPPAGAQDETAENDDVRRASGA